MNLTHRPRPLCSKTSTLLLLLALVSILFSSGTRAQFQNLADADEYDIHEKVQEKLD